MLADAHISSLGYLWLNEWENLALEEGRIHIPPNEGALRDIQKTAARETR